jgi:hypothetical protein
MPEYQNRTKRYHEAIRKAFLMEWDPIGVGEISEAQDEYDGYIGSIYKLLIQRSPVSKIFDYLWWLETEHMGLAGDRQKTEHFAERLARLPEEIDPPPAGPGTT